MELLPLLAATVPLDVAVTLGGGRDGAGGGCRQARARERASESRGQGTDGVVADAAAADVEAFIFFPLQECQATCAVSVCRSSFFLHSRLHFDSSSRALQTTPRSLSFFESAKASSRIPSHLFRLEYEKLGSSES